MIAYFRRASFVFLIILVGVVNSVQVLAQLDQTVSDQRKPPPGTVAETINSDRTDASLVDGPLPPIAPDVMRRDDQGRTTVRAIKLSAGIVVDGRLDEPVYQSIPAITDFIQQVPDPGATATERTEAWIMFDETNVYVSARVWDSAPESEWIANEMRRDTSQLRQNDTFTVFFDTFYDRRNGFNFYTNPLGARADQQFTNEGNPNSDWNPVWDVRTGRFDGGWTAEMEIPFKTLRYRSGSPQVWGVQLRRSIRRKNEWVYLTRLPISGEEVRLEFFGAQPREHWLGLKRRRSVEISKSSRTELVG